MNLNIIQEENKIKIQGLKDFEPKHIFECGQCFRWKRNDDDSYTYIAKKKVVNVKKEEDYVIFTNTTVEDFNNLWCDYFDLNRDYGHIKEVLSNDEILADATIFGHGIRILKQNPWEILISFIISANNRIPMIKKSIKTLSEQYGEYIGEYNGEKYYAFPTVEKLAELKEEDIRACYTGFRAKYVLGAARRILEQNIDLYKIKDMTTEEGREILMKFSGIGPKVADCILLFSMDKMDAFPIDIWVKRVMEYFYLKEDTKLKDIQSYATEKFGEYAGIAQQYLFYYAREKNIGKKK